MADTKKQLAACQARVLAEEENTASIIEAGKKVESETSKFRGEMKKLEAEVAKCEEDKASKDNQIATLGEEVQHQKHHCSSFFEMPIELTALRDTIHHKRAQELSWALAAALPRRAVPVA